jgi:hypothetical protein
MPGHPGFSDQAASETAKPREEEAVQRSPPSPVFACTIISYTAMLPIQEPTVSFVSGLLAAERARRGTRRGRRVLSRYRARVCPRRDPVRL